MTLPKRSSNYPTQFKDIIEEATSKDVLITFPTKEKCRRMRALFYGYRRALDLEYNTLLFKGMPKGSEAVVGESLYELNTLLGKANRLVVSMPTEKTLLVKNPLLDISDPLNVALSLARTASAEAPSQTKVAQTKIAEESEPQSFEEIDSVATILNMS